MTFDAEMEKRLARSCSAYESSYVSVLRLDLHALLADWKQRGEEIRVLTEPIRCACGKHNKTGVEMMMEIHKESIALKEENERLRAAAPKPYWLERAAQAEARIKELESAIDRADEHTKGLMERIEGLEAALRVCLGYVRATESSLLTQPNIVTRDREQAEHALAGEGRKKCDCGKDTYDSTRHEACYSCRNDPHWKDEGRLR